MSDNPAPWWNANVVTAKISEIPSTHGTWPSLFFKAYIEALSKQPERKEDCYLRPVEFEQAPAVLIKCRRNARQWEAALYAATTYQLKQLHKQGIICKDCATFAQVALDSIEVDDSTLEHLYLTKDGLGCSDYSRKMKTLSPSYFYSEYPWGADTPWRRKP